MVQREPIPAKALFAPLCLALAFAVAVVALPIVPAANVWHLASGHLLRNLIIFAVVAVIAGSVVSVSALIRQERRRAVLEEVRAFGRGNSAWTRWASVVVPHVYLALLLATFSTYKQLVLPSAGFGLDFAFAEMDRYLFFGTDAWRMTHWLAPSATATRMIDTAYMLWFLPMILIVLVSWIMPARQQTQYLLAFAMVWIVAGTLLAFLLPGGGPCYFEPLHGDPSFASLMERLNGQSAELEAAGYGPLKALMGQTELLTAYQQQSFILAGGISAMPSLHVALAVLFACAGFATHRPTGYALAGFAGIIFFGSVHLGWHYAVDGLLGGAVSLLLWKLAGAWTAQLYDRGKESPPAPELVPQAPAA
jgi:hypothetical protein